MDNSVMEINVDLENSENIDVWQILYSQIVEPAMQKGYSDVAYCVGDTVPVKEVKDKLDMMDSTLGAFAKFNFLIIDKTEGMRNFDESINDMNGFLKGRSAPLEDYERFAICYFVFKEAGKWLNKNQIIWAVLDHFELRDRFDYKENVHILYDTTAVDLKIISSIKDYTKELEEAIGGQS